MGRTRTGRSEVCNDPMIRASATKRRLGVLLLGAMVAAGAAPVCAEESKTADTGWQFRITPYLWFPDIAGTLTYTNVAGSGTSISTNVDPSSYLESLAFAGMFTAEARKGDWFLFTDYIHLHLSSHDSAVQSITGPNGIVAVPVNVAGSQDVVSNVWTLAGGANLVHEPAVSLDFFGGARLLNLRANLSWDFAAATGSLAKSGNASQTFNEWDAIVGLKGEVRFGDSHWFMPYYVDIGGATSNSTWQALLGVGYRFGWGDVAFVLRSLSYNFDSKDNQLDMHMTGPALGASFKF
jgi:hypothetical protein